MELLTVGITKNKEVCGGSPRIDGTRIRVMDVVEKYEFLGYSPEKIAEAFGISISQVFGALYYYHENPNEIKQEIKNHKEFVENLRAGNAK